MSKGLEALNRIGNMPTQNNMGLVMINVLRDYDIIEKELKRLEELETMYSNCVIEGAKQKKAFDTLSKENEKVMKELSKEIEKNRALEIIKELFDFDFALRFPNNQPMLMITNKYGGSYFEIPISKDKYDLLKKVLL